MPALLTNQISNTIAWISQIAKKVAYIDPKFSEKLFLSLQIRGGIPFLGEWTESNTVQAASTSQVKILMGDDWCLPQNALRQFMYQTLLSQSATSPFLDHIMGHVSSSLHGFQNTSVQNLESEELAFQSELIQEALVKMGFQNLTRTKKDIRCTKKGVMIWPKTIDRKLKNKTKANIAKANNELDHAIQEAIIFKLTKGDAPDTVQMNKRVRELIAEALRAEGVEEIYTIGEDKADAIDIFDEDYLARINKIKLPNTKIQLLQKMLQKAIGDFKKVNQVKGIDFSRRFEALVEQYNERRENDVLNGEELDAFSQEMTDMIYDMAREMGSFADLGIDLEEKAFFDILEHMQKKYDFTYDADKMLELAKAMKVIVDNVAKYPDFAKRDDIKATLKVDLILLLHKYGFPPVANDDVYKSVLEQAENYKKYRG
ncbi:type I restriction enzyme endonuclease domain-containing protein [Marinomonas polaris]|uniref:type I restriction enzyme endonuclease domain-containing protein n=1 Tax=Marinomonas polaris TaxID=293552 RepID=UPI0035139A1A